VNPWDRLARDMTETAEEAAAAPALGAGMVPDSRLSRGPSTSPAATDWHALAGDLKRERLKGSLAGVDPAAASQAAERAALARSSGVPVELLADPATAASVAEKERLAKLHRDAEALAARVDGFGQWLGQPGNAAVAADDLLTLGKVADGLAGLGRDAAQQFTAGLETSEAGKLGYRLLLGVELSPEEAERLAELDGKQQPNSDYWFTGAAANLAGTMAGSLETAATRGLQVAIPATAAGAMLSGPAAPLGGAVGAGTGFAVGATAGLVEEGGTVNAGLAYLEFRKLQTRDGRPIDDGAARLAAMAVGVLTGPLEAVGLGKILSAFPILRNLTGEGARALVGQVLRRPTVADALATFAREYAGGIGAEVTTEMLQAAVEVIGGELAKLIDGGDFDRAEAGDVLEAMIGAGLFTAEGMVIAGLPGPSASFAVDYTRARRAERDFQHWLQVGTDAEASALLARDRGRFGEFLASVAGEGPVDAVRVDAARFGELFQSEGLDPAEVARQLGISEQWAVARDQGGDLAIPLRAYGEHLVGTTYHQALAPHIRTTADGMTAAEAAAFFADLERDATETAERVVAGGAAAASQGGRAIVFDDVREQLIKAGRAPDVAEREATLYSTIFGTLGTWAGVDPAELYRRYNFTVRRELPGELAEMTDAELDAALGRTFRPDAVGSAEGVAAPGAAPGAGPPTRDRTFLPDGSSVEVDYVVVEAADLLTSNTDDMGVNAAYPAELQPRDRSRAASGEQVQRLAGGLVPELLGRSATAADGAPIVGPDGVVESGNGRVLALRRAYAGGLPTGKAYRDWLAGQGYQVEGMRAPVLVRRRVSDLSPDARVAFTRSANERTTATMSASEQARADAAQLDADLLGMIRGPDVGSAANRPFVRRFLGRIAGENELGALVDRSGELSIDGRRRVRSALLVRAFGDMAIVERLLEEDESGLGPLGRALLDLAPTWAALDDAASTAGLMEAVRSIIRTRDQGVPPHFALDQGDMLGNGLSADGAAFLGALIVATDKGSSRLKGRARIVEKLGAYLEEAGQRSPGLLGDDVATPAQMLEALGRKEADGLRDLVEELGLDGETVTAAELRAAVETAPEMAQDGEALFQDGEGERGPAPVAVLTGDELGVQSAEPRELRRAARAVYRTLQNNPVERSDLGPIAFTGKGWDELVKTGADPRKWQMLPALRQIVEGAEYVGPVPLTKPRTDGIVRFHWLEAVVELAGESLRVGIQVGEDAKGQKFFNLNQDLDAWVARYGAAGGSGIDSGRRRSAKPEGSDPNIDALGDGINLAIDDDGTTLQQRKKKGADPRGSITFNKRSTILRLFQGADLSTVIHETGHFMLEVLGDLATAEGAPADLALEYAKILAWLGVADRSGIKREHHEQFARGFEAYLMEGKAPSAELESAFARFRAWLVAIYRDVRRLNVELTDDVRRVFDRLLASADAIEAQANALRLDPMPLEAAGMTPEQYADYLAKVDAARTKAENDLIAKAMRDVARERTKAWKEERAKLRDDVAAEVDALPAMRAVVAMSRGLNGGPPLRLNTAALAAEFDAATVDALKRRAVPPIVAKGGLAPDMVAPLLGYASGADLVRAVLSLPPRSELIEQETDRRMRERHGDILKNGDIAEAAAGAIAGEEVSGVLAAEMLALGEGIRELVLPLAAIRKAAERALMRGKLEAVRNPSVHLHAAQRLAKRALELLAKGDRRGAYDAKRQQLFHFETYRIARRLGEDVDKALNRFGALNKATVRGRIARDILEQLDQLLERFDFRKGVTEAKRAKRRALADWIEEQKSLGIDPDIPDHLARDAFRQHYRDMSVEDFMALRDAVASLEHVGRMKQKLLTSREKRAFDDAVGEVVAAIYTNTRAKTESLDFTTSGWKKFKEALSGFYASHVKLEFLFERLDGFTRGPVSEYLFQPLARAEAAEAALRGRLVKGLAVILDRYSSRERGEWLTRKRYIPELGATFNKASLLSMALNWGNEGNRAALVRGYKWDAATVQRVLFRELDARDWQTVQSIWDLVDSLWPEIAALETDLVGKAPDKVERQPLRGTPAGDLAGGYYPLVYDSRLSDKVAAREEKQAVTELFGGNWARPQTRKGHTKARVGSGGLPVRLELAVFSTHLMNATHDITHRRAIIDVLRMIEHPDVRLALVETAGRELYRMIKPWLQEIAAPPVSTRTPIERILSRARTGVTITYMAWKMTSIVSQISGFMQTASMLGHARTGKALTWLLANPLTIKRKVDEALARSPALRHRQKIFDRDVGHALKKLTETGKVEGVHESYFWAMGVLDMLVAVPTWYAGYEKGLRDFNGDAEKATEYADQVVRMTQSAGGAKDLPAFQRGGELPRLFTMFYSYFSSTFNLADRAIRKFDPKKPGDYPQLVGSLFSLMVMAPILNELLVGRGPEDDESWLGWGASTVAAYPFMTMVVVRDVAGALSSGFGYQLSPVETAGDALIKSVQALADLASGEDLTRSGVKALVSAAGIWGLPFIGQFPAGQLYITGEYLFDVLTGEHEPEDVGDILQHGLLRRRPEAWGKR
jgi:hypothetical protein